MSLINSKYRVVSCVKRHIHLCLVLTSAENKQARVLAKLMTGAHRKKKSWVRTEFLAKSPILPSANDFQIRGQGKRRVDVLNKLFMRSITDLLATGEVLPYLIGLGISITGVKVLSDFSSVNVYWTSSETVHDEKLDLILKKAGFDLRHHLTQLHIMGIVPKICFVADKWQVISEQTAQALEKAKSEKGYESEDLKEEFKSGYNESLDAKIFDEVENPDGLYSLPPMVHNVHGLDHATIMSKIQVAVKKSEASHRRKAMGGDDSVSYVVPSDETVKSSSVDPSYISHYIRKRRIEEKKSQKALQKQLLAVTELNSQPSEEYYVDIEDGDFIDEFEDLMNSSSELREK